jgi:hypothetical protein
VTKTPDNVFVFGSNESGIHGAGAARSALESHGAKFGQGFGLQGSAFGIPTKDWQIGPLHMVHIEHYVNRFMEFARMNPDSTFNVTAIGCGLAGYRHSDIAPLFKHAPKNCTFDLAWKPILGEGRLYWGTFG